jgi:hypothetical protein
VAYLLVHGDLPTQQQLDDWIGEQSILGWELAKKFGFTPDAVAEVAAAAGVSALYSVISRSFTVQTSTGMSPGRALRMERVSWTTLRSTRLIPAARPLSARPLLATTRPAQRNPASPGRTPEPF